MGRARALVQLPLDRWRSSRHFGISHIFMTSAVFELWVFSIFDEKGGVRALVQVLLDRWSLSGHFGIRHFALT